MISNTFERDRFNVDSLPLSTGERIKSYLIFCQRIVLTVGNSFDFRVKMMYDQSRHGRNETKICTIRMSYLILVKLLISFNADSLNSLSLFAYRQATMFHRDKSNAAGLVYRRRIDCRIRGGIGLSRRTLRRRLRVF